MKNHDNEKLLAHKRAVDEHRRAQAILRQKARRRKAAEAMARIAAANNRAVTP